jgi:uncharacterized protein (DUF1330 family)
VTLTFVMLADIQAGAESAFQRYESLVLPLLDRHGGHLERRMRTDDGLTEVHIVSFPSKDRYESYMADSERQSHRSVLEGFDVVQRLLQINDVPVR